MNMATAGKLSIENTGPFKSARIAGLLCVAAAAVLWGTTGTAQSFIGSDGLPPYWVGGFRLLFATLFFIPLSLFVEARRRSTAETGCDAVLPLREIPLKTRLLMGAAGLSMAAYNLLFFAGVKAAGIGIGTAVVIGSSPIWAGTIGAIVTKKAPKALWIAGTAVAVAGGALMAIGPTVLLVPQGKAESSTVFASLSYSSIGICLAAGFAYACYTWLSKTVVATVTPLTATTVTFATALVIAFPAAYVIAGMPNPNLESLAVALYLGLFATGAAYLLFTTGLKVVSAATGVALSLIEPVMAFLLAVLVAGESWSLTSVAGLGSILCGLAVILRSDAKA